MAARRVPVAVTVVGMLQDPAFHMAKCTAEVTPGLGPVRSGVGWQYINRGMPAPGSSSQEEDIPDFGVVDFGAARRLAPRQGAPLQHPRLLVPTPTRHFTAVPRYVRCPAHCSSARLAQQLRTSPLTQLSVQARSKKLQSSWRFTDSS